MQNGKWKIAFSNKTFHLKSSAISRQAMKTPVAIALFKIPLFLQTFCRLIQYFFAVFRVFCICKSFCCLSTKNEYKELPSSSINYTTPRYLLKMVDMMARYGKSLWG